MLLFCQRIPESSPKQGQYHSLQSMRESDFSQAMKMPGWRSWDSKLGRAGCQVKGTWLALTCTWCLLPTVSMSGTAAPSQKSWTWIPLPSPCQSNHRNAHLPRSNARGQCQGSLRDGCLLHQNITTKVSAASAATTPQVEIPGWGCRPCLNTSPSFDKDLGHSCQVCTSGSLLRHVVSLMPEETKIRKALWG